MAHEYFDGIEWDIEDMPSIVYSGDDDDWIQEHEANGIDENGKEVTGTATYRSDRFDGFHFESVEYETVEDDEDDETDEDEDY
jgi:hypothetical protein